MKTNASIGTANAVPFQNWVIRNSLRNLNRCGYKGFHSEPPLDRCAGLLRPAPRRAMLGIVTGMWPVIGISPNIARTALISETCMLENVHKYVCIPGNWDTT